MLSQTIAKLPGHAVLASRLPGAAHVPGAGAGCPVCRAASSAVSARPPQAPAVATATRAELSAGAFAFAGNAPDGVSADHRIPGHPAWQKTTRHTMWALRGLDTWSDPA